MLPSRSWPSPSPAGLFYGAAAWEWLRHYKLEGLTGEYNIRCSWVSKLVPPRTILHPPADPSMARLVLAVGPRGVLWWRLEAHDDAHGVYYTMSLDGSPIEWGFVQTLDEIVVRPYKATFIQGVGVVFMVSEGEPMPLLKAALLAPVCLDKQDLGALCLMRNLPALPPSSSKVDLISHLCSSTFDLDPTSVEFQQIVAKASQVPDSPEEALANNTGGEMNEELADLVDEICLQDVDNVAEVRSLKAAMSQKLRQTLVDLKAQHAEATRRKAQRGRLKALAPKARQRLRRRPATRRIRDAEPREAAAREPIRPAPSPASLGDEVRPPASASGCGSIVVAAPAGPAEPAAAAAVVGEFAIVPFNQTSAPRQPHLPPRARRSHTPAIVDTLVPKGAKVTVDLYALRWKGQYHNFLCSKGWYSTGLTRREALEYVLGELWRSSGTARPEECQIDRVDSHLWEGALDPVADERPIKRIRL